MISGFINDKVNVNIRYVNMPTSMTDKFSVSHDTVNVFRIRFNNIFKNEKIMYATIAVLISLFSLITGFTIYYIYDTYKMDTHPISVNEGFLPDEMVNENTSNLDALYSAEYNPSGAGVSPDMPSSYGTPNSPNGGGEFNSLGVVPRKGRKIIDVEDEAGDEVLIGTKEKKIKLAVNETSRKNPFVPYTSSATSRPSYPEPPANLLNSSDAAKAMKTSITGILYDKYSPSAIINIQGADYLVKVNDTIYNYKILGITPTTVTVKLGANVYSAGVGEQISGEIDYNVISNLNKKFGGSSGVDGSSRYQGERL